MQGNKNSNITPVDIRDHGDGDDVNPAVFFSAAFGLRTVLLKAVRSRPDAARSRPDTARNSTAERSERNKSHTNYMLTTCSVPSSCHAQDELGK